VGEGFWMFVRSDTANVNGCRTRSKRSVLGLFAEWGRLFAKKLVKAELSKNFVP